MSVVEAYVNKTKPPDRSTCRPPCLTGYVELKPSSDRPLPVSTRTGPGRVYVSRPGKGHQKDVEFGYLGHEYPFVHSKTIIYKRGNVFVIDKQYY